MRFQFQPPNCRQRGWDSSSFEINPTQSITKAFVPLVWTRYKLHILFNHFPKTLCNESFWIRDETVFTKWREFAICALTDTFLLKYKYINKYICNNSRNEIVQICTKYTNRVGDVYLVQFPSDLQRGGLAPTVLNFYNMLLFQHNSFSNLNRNFCWKFGHLPKKYIT